MALIEQDDRVERDDERSALQAERKRSDALEAALDNYCNEVEDLARSALHAAGYHRPKREWRKRRVRHRES